MQKPLPESAKAWCVPPAVLQAKPWRSASSAVSSVPATSALVRSTSTWLRTVAPKPMLHAEQGGCGGRGS